MVLFIPFALQFCTVKQTLGSVSILKNYKQKFKKENIM